MKNFKIYLSILILTFLNHLAYSQFQQNNVFVQQNVYSSNSYGLSLIAHEISSFRNSWENKHKRAEEVQKAQAQLELVKAKYKSSESYPENIIDGWHNVMATDNYNYCSTAKVLIKNNQIIKFVIGDWIELSQSFESISPISKGKALISVEFENRMDMLELYFILDLRKPTTVDEPLNSSYITFWSNERKADHIKVWVENEYYGELAKRIIDIPDCGTDGTISIMVKPGTYKFKAAGRGSIAWEGIIETKENNCSIILLNKDNKK